MGAAALGVARGALLVALSRMHSTPHAARCTGPCWWHSPSVDPVDPGSSGEDAPTTRGRPASAPRGLPGAGVCSAASEVKTLWSDTQGCALPATVAQDGQTA